MARADIRNKGFHSLPNGDRFLFFLFNDLENFSITALRIVPCVQWFLNSICSEVLNECMS